MFAASAEMRGATSTIRPPVTSTSMPVRPSASVALRIRRSAIAEARSLGAEDTVTGIAQPRHDVAMLVELPIDRGGIYRDVRMRGLERGDPLRRRDEAHEADAARPRLLQPFHRGHRGVSRRQHRIE